MAEPRRHTIVCLSSQDWSDGMWTNKQHIMSRLGRKHHVLHVDFSPMRLAELARRKIRQDKWSALHPVDMLLAPYERTEDAVTVLDFHSSALLTDPFRHGNPLRVFGSFDLRVHLLKRYLERERILDPIVWVYHPGFGGKVRELPHKLIVYDCVDEYSAFPEFRGHESWIRQRERELCGEADLVFTTSRALYDTKRALKPDDTHLVHNVGDAEHFGKAMDPATEVPAELTRLERPIVGFVGAVSDYKLDTEWVLALARARPDWSIVLIGPTGVADPGTDTRRLEELPNVHLLGRRDYPELPGYLRGFDLAVIPYRINDYTRAVFPIKFFEFMATGKPVVISKLPALEEFYDAVRVAGSAEEFVERCSEALSEPDTGRERRLALAETHSWPARIAKLMSLIDAKLDERGAD